MSTDPHFFSGKIFGKPPHNFFTVGVFVRDGFFVVLYVLVSFVEWTQKLLFSTSKTCIFHMVILLSISGLHSLRSDNFSRSPVPSVGELKIVVSWYSKVQFVTLQTKMTISTFATLAFSASSFSAHADLPCNQIRPLVMVKLGTWFSYIQLMAPLHLSVWSHSFPQLGSQYAGPALKVLAQKRLTTNLSKRTMIYVSNSRCFLRFRLLAIADW